MAPDRLPLYRRGVTHVRNRLRVPMPSKYVGELLEGEACETALDVGCGPSSVLASFRTTLRTVGIDVFPASVAAAKAQGTHDAYIVGDVLALADEEILAPIGGERYDVVLLLHLIEHFPKSVGYDLLDRCERLTKKFVVVDTPNGFLDQGPEDGNEFQRHRSGWFVHDFEGLGYRVHGSFGTKYIRGYAGHPKVPVPGAGTVDALLANVLRIGRHPRRGAFSLVAVKDVRGVPARLATGSS